MSGLIDNWAWPEFLNGGSDWREVTYKDTLPTTGGDPEPEQPKVTIEQLRTLLNQWVTLDERRHPEFQAKELLEQSKEAIKNSRI